jgi:sugar phosphate isomerase/epimerase
MRLSFSTLGCPTLSLSEVSECAVRCGYDTLEIRLDRENRLLGFDADNAAEARRVLDAYGMNVICLGTGLTFFGEAGEHTEKIDACARLARAVGARALRIFAGAFVKHPTEISDKELAEVAASISYSAQIAEKYGVSLWIETHSAYSTGKSVAALMERINAKNVGVIWDIMHSIEFGEAPQKTVRYLGKHIVHVHLKDGVPPTGAESAHYVLTALGKGAVEFGEIAVALKEIGYGGYLSLEWELMWHPELGECYKDTDELLLAYRELVGEKMMK